MPQRFPFPQSSTNRKRPYNPFAPSGAKGDVDDPTQYIQPPGVVFYQPWLAIPNGPAFVWPLGLQGFSDSIEPTLGVHKYYGDNKVAVNVVHRGEEHITMNGNFSGLSAKDSVDKLKDVVYAAQPPQGKILYLPGLMSYAQRVAVVRASFDRDVDERGTEMTYTIEFVRLGIENKFTDPDLAAPTPQPTKGKQRPSSRVFVVTATKNTLRKIAATKKTTWLALYNKNKAWFTKHKVSAHKVPDYKLPIGTKVYF